MGFLILSIMQGIAKDTDSEQIVYNRASSMYKRVAFAIYA